MKHSIKIFCAASALIVPCLAGCGGSTYGVGDAPVTTPAPQPHSISAPLSNGLTATVAEDRTSVKAGGVVTYTLTLTNNTAQPITFQPERGGGPSVGVGDALIVKNADSDLVYPQGEYAQVVTVGPSQTLAPGQSVSATEGVGLYNTGGTFSPAGRYSTSVAFTLKTSGTAITDTVGPLAVVAQ